MPLQAARESASLCATCRNRDSTLRVSSLRNTGAFLVARASMATDVNCDERAIAMRRPRGFWHDQGGLSSLEYAVLFVIVCVGALALWRTLGRSLVCQMTEADATFNATLGGGRNDTRPSYCRERNAAVSGSVPMSVGGPAPRRISGPRRCQLLPARKAPARPRRTTAAPPAQRG